MTEIEIKLQMIKRTNLSLFVAILLTCDSVFLVTRIIVIHIDCVLFSYYIYFHISFIFIPFHTNLTLCSLTVLLFPLICSHVQVNNTFVINKLQSVHQPNFLFSLLSLETTNNISATHRIFPWRLLFFPEELIVRMLEIYRNDFVIAAAVFFSKRIL